MRGSIEYTRIVGDIDPGHPLARDFNLPKHWAQTDRSCPEYTAAVRKVKQAVNLLITRRVSRPRIVADVSSMLNTIRFADVPARTPLFKHDDTEYARGFFIVSRRPLQVADVVANSGASVIQPY